MAYSRLSHKGGAVQNTLGSQLLVGGTTISLSSTPSGWPAAGAPFFVVIDPGTAKEEKLSVVYVSGTTLNVVDETDYTDPWDTSPNGRGVDDTTAYQHESGAVIYPVFTAREADQANELVASYTANGDIVVHGSTSFKKIAVGMNAHVLQADSSITDGGVKWGQVTADGIATDAVTADKIAAGAVGASELASNAVEEAKINAGAVTAAKIGSSAVETAKINNGAVTAAKLASDSIQLLAPTGSITQYGGSSAPTGWLLCDGTEVAIATYTALYNVLTSSGTVFPFGANTNGSGGAGSTHFRLPNFKGRVPVGLDSGQTEFDTMGETGGAKTHTLTIAEMPSHGHTQDAHNHSQNAHGHTINNHAHGASISTDGNHNHEIPSRTTTSTSHSHVTSLRVASAPSPSNANDFTWTSDNGSHNHSITVDAAGLGANNNTATNVPTTATNQNTGGSGSHNNLQPYITINYIVKT